MWHFLFNRERGDETVEQCREWADSEFHNRKAVVHVGKKNIRVLVPAEINDQVATLLAKSHCLLPGSAHLIWFEPYMESDLRRVFTKNDELPFPSDKLMDSLFAELRRPGGMPGFR